MHPSLLLTTFAATALAIPAIPLFPVLPIPKPIFPLPLVNATKPAVPTAAAFPFIQSIPLPIKPPQAIILNKCPFPVFVTSVGKNGISSPTSEVPTGATWTEAQYWTGTGTAIDITRTVDGLYMNAPMLVLGYAYKAGTSLFYDINVRAGNPFPGGTIKLSGAGGDTTWFGTPTLPSTKSFFGSTDITLTLCL